MEIIDIPIDRINAPEWNANLMEAVDRARLRKSIQHFDLVMPLVVRLRPVHEDCYETVGGAQRLAVLMELGAETVPCVIVEADDAEARLLAQVLNHVHGDDDLGLRAENFRRILETHSQEEVLAILPETTESLKVLVSLGEADLSQHLQAWQAAQAARLRHMTIQLLPTQLEVVEEALERALAGATKNEENPNRRGNALFQLCTEYLNTNADKETE